MKFKIEHELNKIRLMVLYANKLVDKLGVERQYFLGGLDFNVDTRYFDSILRTSGVYADFKENKRVTFNVRSSLYKRFGKRVEYITLLDCHDDDQFRQGEYCYYEKKSHIDGCSVMIALKSTIRKMIKEPDNYWQVKNC